MDAHSRRRSLARRTVQTNDASSATTPAPVSSPEVTPPSRTIRRPTNDQRETGIRRESSVTALRGMDSEMRAIFESIARTAATPAISVAGSESPSLASISELPGDMAIDAYGSVVDQGHASPTPSIRSSALSEAIDPQRSVMRGSLRGTAFAGAVGSQSVRSARCIAEPAQTSDASAFGHRLAAQRSAHSDTMGARALRTDGRVLSETYIPHASLQDPTSQAPSAVTAPAQTAAAPQMGDEKVHEVVLPIQDAANTSADRDNTRSGFGDGAQRVQGDAPPGHEHFMRGQALLFPYDAAAEGRDAETQAARETLAAAAYRRSAQLGHLLGETVLAFCHEFGIGVPMDYKAAEAGYWVAARHGEAVAQTRMAFLRKYGRPGVRIDRVEAEEWARLVNHIEAGGDAYAVLPGISPGRAGPLAGTLGTATRIAWLIEAAAAHRHPAAQYCLGICFHDGLGVPRNAAEAVRWYTLSAEAGHARGQGILGYCYGEGFGVQKDEAEAMRWYRLAAAQGESVAIYNIGYCYEDGIGVEKNEAEAVRWYRRAAEMGNAFAQNSLGYCFEDGIGTPRDASTAVYWYRLSAKQGYPWAQCNLGYCYQNGIGVARNDAKGAKWYYRAAVQGHARAQHNYGYCLQNGIGVPKDAAEAIAWYRRSAAQKNAFAYHSLGYCYQNGIGVERNEAEAVAWFRRSAELNHAPAQLSLGYCYRNGIGVDKDERAAFAWFERCAAQGNAMAQNSLGYCYEEGIGCERDHGRAFACYRQAAEQGNAWAQCNLAYCYAEGMGTGRSLPDAFAWYRAAARQNLPRAMGRLGYMYEHGHGVEASAERAYRWYERASRAGNLTAQYHMARCLEHGVGVAPDRAAAMVMYQRAAAAGEPQSVERVRQLIFSIVELDAIPTAHCAPAA